MVAGEPEADFILTNPEWWVREFIDKGPMYVQIHGAIGREAGAVDLEYHPGDPSQPVAITSKYKALYIARRVLVGRGYRRVDLL